MSILLYSLLAALAAVLVIHLLHAVFVDSRFEYTQASYTSPKLAALAEGYTLLFLTDIHRQSLKKLAALVERANQTPPDLVLFGGDFGARQDLEAVLDLLAGIKSKNGFYGVEGNHDDPARLGALMAARGMTLLENQGVRINDALYLVGLEDLWNRRPDAAAALAGRPPADAAGGPFTLALAHNPDTALDTDCTGLDLMLCGHTHGGEMTIFGGLAPSMPIVSRYWQRFKAGWCKGAHGLDVYVCRGLGRTVFRVYARYEALFLTLLPSKNSR